MDEFVRSKLGMGLPPRRDEMISITDKTLTDDLDKVSIGNELIRTEKNLKDESYMESVLREIDEDLDSMISCIDDYRGLLSSQTEKKEWKGKTS